MITVLVLVIVLQFALQYLTSRDFHKQLRGERAERQVIHSRFMKQTGELQDVIGRLNEFILRDAGKQVSLVPRRAPLEKAEGWLDGKPVEKFIKPLDK